MYCSPLFVDYNIATGVTTVQDREFRTFQTALNVYRKEKDMTAYLQLLEAQQRAHHNTGTPIERVEPEIDSKQFEISAKRWIGQELMVRFRALESISYNIQEQTIVLEEGEETGWFLYSPANVKGVLDRTLYLDDKSYFFGDATGRVFIVASKVIGCVNNSVIRKSMVNYSYTEKSFIRNSCIQFGRTINSRVLHSELRHTTMVRSIASSSNLNQCTMVASRVTDLQAVFVGLRNSVVSYMQMNSCKLTDFNRAGNGEELEKQVNVNVVAEFERHLKMGDVHSKLEHVIADKNESESDDDEIIPAASAVVLARKEGSVKVIDVSGDNQTAEADSELETSK